MNIKKSIENTLKIESESVANLVNVIDIQVIEQVINKISNLKGKVIISGCGTSGTAAKKIVHSLSCISIASLYLNPSDAVHGSMGIIREDDIVILISKGGNTSELTKLINSIKTNKAFLIGVGENEDSTIGKESDLFIKVAVEKEPDKFNMLATASTLAVISVFDAICIALMDTMDFSKSKFALNHPGGAVGERLLHK